MEKFEKMKKISTMVEGFLKIIRIIFIVVGIVTAVCVTMFSVMWFTGNTNLCKYFASIDTKTLQIGNIRLTLENITLSEKYLLGFLVLAVCTIGSAIALSLYMIHQLQKVFYPMSLGQPFNTEVSRSIRNMAGGVLIGGSLIQLLNMLTQIFQYKSFSMHTLFLNSHVSTCTMDLTFKIQYLIWAGLLLLLSYVFRYGEELQKQADETL